MKYKMGCLIIHKIGGAISDVKPLSKHLQSKGFVTFCPSFKCNVANKRAFSNISYREWIQSAEQGLNYLKSKCKDVIIIGFNIGGLIAINLAAQFKKFAVITVNASTYYWDVKNAYYNIIINFKTRNFANIKRYIRTLTGFSISGLVNFMMLIKNTKHILGKVRSPIFIIQSLGVDGINYKSAEYIYKKVSSGLKVLKYYDNLADDLSDSSNYYLIFSDIEKFVKEVLQRKNATNNKFYLIMDI